LKRTAQKYAFLQVFCIPTRELKDPEHDDHEIKPKEKKQGFDPKNAAHMRWLAAEFEKRGIISGPEREAIIVSLSGRPSSDLDIIIKEAVFGS